MKAVLAAVGSWGDVAPFAVLAKRLRTRGHEPVMVTHSSFAARLRGDVRVVGVESDPARLLDGPAGRALLSGNPRALNRARRHFADFLTACGPPAREALTGADVLVGSTFAVAAVEEALKAGVPVIRAHQWPERPGPDGPLPLLPYSWRLPGPVRRAARNRQRAMERLLAGFDGWWERGRLRVVPHHPVDFTTATSGTLLAFSPHVAGDDAAYLNPRLRATGWWQEPAVPGLSPGTERLLAGGDRWIYVGFGSMPTARPVELVTQVAEACRRVGVRAVVQIEGAPTAPDGVVVGIGREPHVALFSRVAAVVHHGGSGTTGSSARAGVPTIVVPHFADQFYWGHRIAVLGVGPAPVPRPLLTGRRLAARLEAALAPDMRRAAAGLGDAVRSEDGAGAAVDGIEQLLADRTGNGLQR